MQQEKPGDAQRPQSLLALVAEAAGRSPERLRPERTLAEQGIHGLARLRVLRALVRRCSGVPPWEIMGRPSTLRDLLAWAASDDPGQQLAVPVNRLLVDAALAPDIQPATAQPPADDRCVLVTGATGFFGPNLLEALLEGPHTKVYCLVRGESWDLAYQRLVQHLRARGLWRTDWAGRLEAVAGDTTQPQLGLERTTYEWLSEHVDAVYHAAAAVNWAQPYEGLHAANVRATEEMLRFACHGRTKRFAFISSTVVCHTVGGPVALAEADEITPYLGGLYLGYAQSKWVAEQLVMEAGERGLPTLIHRPPFVAGDTRDAVANGDDLPARLLSASLRCGLAPDVDWPMDACPADFLARAVVRLNVHASPATPVYHLRGDRPTTWRQLVLCMNLYGYPIRLTDYDRWLKAVRGSTRAHWPLRPLKPLFSGRPEGVGTPALAELLQRHRVSEAANAATGETLAREGLQCPEIRPGLLKRYIEHFIDTGVFPPPERPMEEGGWSRVADAIAGAVDACGATQGWSIVDTTRLPLSDGGDSIVTELSALVNGQVAGLFPLRLHLNRATGATTRDVLVKVKAHDTTTLAVARAIAALEDPALANEYDRISSLLPFNGGHAREAAVYSLPGEALRRHMPDCYGHVYGPDGQGCALVLENLSGAGRLGGSDPLTRAELTGALDCLAAVHGEWLGRTEALTGASWLPPRPGPSERAAMGAFWERLSALTVRYARQLGECRLAERCRDLVETRSHWLADDAGLPVTLVHNDFNPRNLAFFGHGVDALHCMAYDWELATLGLPQRDLAELLCFAMEPSDIEPSALMERIDDHRRQLIEHTGTALPAREWLHGFRYAMRELLVERLGLYVLVDTVDRQPFLPRVLRSWLAIHDALETHG